MAACNELTPPANELAHQRAASLLRAGTHELGAETIRSSRVPTAQRCDRARPADADLAISRSLPCQKDRSRVTLGHTTFRADAGAAGRETRRRGAPQTPVWGDIRCAC